MRAVLIGSLATPLPAVARPDPAGKAELPVRDVVMRDNSIGTVTGEPVVTRNVVRLNIGV